MESPHMPDTLISGRIPVSKTVCPLTLITTFQLEVCVAPTGYCTPGDISNGRGGIDGINVLAFITSRVQVDCPSSGDTWRDESG